MINSCCKRIVKYDLSELGVEIYELRKNYALISFDENKISLKDIDRTLRKSEMSLIITKDQRLVEEIKKAVIELIYHMNNMDSIIRKSDYLVEKLGKSYQTLSKLFSKYEDTTLEKFTIHHKIQKIKELILSDEYSLSEIAFMMDYSSVQYLSNQFKKETGITVSNFKKSFES